MKTIQTNDSNLSTESVGVTETQKQIGAKSKPFFNGFKVITPQPIEVKKNSYGSTTYKVVEYGENFYGKVEYRNERKMPQQEAKKEISGASFRFKTTAEVKQFVANLQEAIKDMEADV